MYSRNISLYKDERGLFMAMCARHEIPLMAINNLFWIWYNRETIQVQSMSGTGDN